MFQQPHAILPTRFMTPAERADTSIHRPMGARDCWVPLEVRTLVDGVSEHAPGRRAFPGFGRRRALAR